MAEKNKLSIYLIKEEFANCDEMILKDSAQLLTDIADVGKVYFAPSQA